MTSDTIASLAEASQTAYGFASRRVQHQQHGGFWPSTPLTGETFIAASGKSLRETALRYQAENEL